MLSLRCFLLFFAIAQSIFVAPAAFAGLCSGVFPSPTTPTGGAVGAVLDLSIMDGKTFADFPAKGENYTASGNWFYNSGSLKTNNAITVTAGQQVRLFFDGNLTFQPHTDINRYGNVEDLLIVVRGDLLIGTNNEIRALIYVTGNVVANPDAKLKGAVTAQGSIELKSGANVDYDPSAAKQFNFGDLCSDGSLHHYQLSYAPQALSCQPHAVTVTACANADCSSTVETSASLVAMDSDGRDVVSVGFTTGTSGSALAALPLRTPGVMSLRVASATSQCNVPGCALNVADTGFILDVPPLLAGKPANASLQAVRKDDATQRCVPAFETGIRTLLFTSVYSSPTSGTLQPLVNGQKVTSATPVEVSFGVQAKSSLQVRYDDAGRMTLSALYAPTTGSEIGLVMRGEVTYVSRPYGLYLSSDLSCSAADIGGCPKLIAAGDSFPLRISAVAWQADGEPRTAADLYDNPITPNFQLAGIALSSVVIAPAGGDSGSLSLTSYSHALGSQTTLNPSQREVGIFRITATPPSGGYFGYTVDGGESGLVGRFTPAWLGASASAQLDKACGAFSYQQQPIGFVGGQGPLLTVTGYNRQGGVTRNYDRGEFWRLAAPQRQDYLSITGRAGLDVAGRLQTSGSAQGTALASDLAGDGARQFRWADDRLLWTAAAQPQADDLPFGVAGSAIARLRLAATQLTDADGVCHAGGGCSDFAFDFGGSEVRLGRLRFGNAFGSELQGLDVPFWLESWQALGGGLNGFRSESGDSCSAPWLGSPALQAVAGSLQPADISGPTVSAPLAGQGMVRLPAPGKEGSVGVGLGGLEGASPLLPWLLYDWNGDGAREAARGLATFGIYRGSAPLIFRREIYR